MLALKLTCWQLSTMLKQCTAALSALISSWRWGTCWVESEKQSTLRSPQSAVKKGIVRQMTKIERETTGLARQTWPEHWGCTPHESSPWPCWRNSMGNPSRNGRKNVEFLKQTQEDWYIPSERPEPLFPSATLH